MARVLGMNAKAYRSTTLLNGTNTDSVTWDEVPNIKDLEISLETQEADVTTRANSGWSQTLASLKDGSIEFEMIWDTADTDFEAIRTAWLNGTELAFMALDGDEGTSGSQGLASNFTVTSFSRSEPLAEALTVSVTLKPSSYTEWYTVA